MSRGDTGVPARVATGISETERGRQLRCGALITGWPIGTAGAPSDAMTATDVLRSVGRPHRAPAR